MAATVAGRVALGLGVTPKVSPRWTGAVDGFAWGTCAGAAAVRAALGWGARIIAGLACFTTGRAVLASICTGFRSGFFSIFGILILGASSLTSGSFGVSTTLGGGGIFIFNGGGGGVVGKINSVCS